MERSLFITDLAVLQLVCGGQWPDRPILRVLIVASYTYLDNTIIPNPSLLGGFIVGEN